MEISELLKDCKVMHIGVSDIKEGDILVFLLSDPTPREVSALIDVLSNMVQLPKDGFLVWRDSLSDIRVMSKQEMIVLRDSIDQFLREGDKK